MPYRVEFDNFFVVPSDDTPPTLRVPFDFRAIEKYPDFMRTWIHSLVDSVSQNPIGKDFLDKKGETSDWDGYSLSNSKIHCAELDALVSALSLDGGADLARKINELRTQVVGMWYYMLRFGMVKDKMYKRTRTEGASVEGEPSCHEECMALYNEMVSGEKFGVPITFRPGMFKIWIRVCDTPEQCKIAYDKMAETKWCLPDGTSGSINGLDDIALKQWISVCRTDKDYDEACQAAKKHGLAECFMAVALQRSESREDFFAVYSVLVKNEFPAPSQGSLIRFFGYLETFDDFAMWLEFLFHWNVIPLISTSEIILKNFNLSPEGSLDAASFLEWFRERYRFLLGGVTSAHENWKIFFDKMKVVLTKRYGIRCYI